MSFYTGSNLPLLIEPWNEETHVHQHFFSYLKYSDVLGYFIHLGLIAEPRWKNEVGNWIFCRDDFDPPFEPPGDYKAAKVVQMLEESLDIDLSERDLQKMSMNEEFPSPVGFDRFGNWFYSSRDVEDYIKQR